MFELLKRLCELPGPGGDEGIVQSWLAQRWGPRAKQLQITPVGNLLAHIGGDGPRILLAAHSDELCFVVKHISDDGFVWITTGQRDTEQRPGSFFLPFGHPALILTAQGPVEGVFVRLTGHVMNADQRAKTKLDWNDIFVDLAARDRGEVEARGVQVGDRVIWNPPTRRMGQLVYGKAIDDRAGLAIMTLLLDAVDVAHLAYDVTFVSTVQEEIGMIGVESAARDAGCELGIAVDIGLAGDVPGVDQRDISARLGSGPVLVHKDLYHYSRSLTLALARTAKTVGIPLQPAVLGLAASDGGIMTRLGMQSALVGVPVRYTHSPFEMVHLGDVERAVELLKAFLETRTV